MISEQEMKSTINNFKSDQESVINEKKNRIIEKIDDNEQMIDHLMQLQSKGQPAFSTNGSIMTKASSGGKSTKRSTSVKKPSKLNNSSIKKKLNTTKVSERSSFQNLPDHKYQPEIENLLDRRNKLNFKLERIQSDLMTHREFYYTINTQSEQIKEIVQSQRNMLLQSNKKLSKYQHEQKRKDLQSSTLTNMYQSDQGNLIQEN